MCEHCLEVCQHGAEHHTDGPAFITVFEEATILTTTPISGPAPPLRSMAVWRGRSFRPSENVGEPITTGTWLVGQHGLVSL
jgi:hypothetical protein